jgi:hypothetical protein
MSLPEYIEALNAPTGNNVPYGIIEQIRGNVTNNNILSYVVATSNVSTWGDTNGPIKWSDHCQFLGKTGYWQIEFKNRFVFPTHYSLKGSSGYSASLKWSLFGFNTESLDLTLLSKDTSACSSFCESLTCDGCGCKNDWGTIAIKYPPNKAFRYFRIAHTSNTYFTFAGIEFFGILSTNGATQSVNNKKSNYCTPIILSFRLQTSLFLDIITLLS